MFACAPGTVGIVGHRRWDAKGFDETDHKLFKEAAELLVSVPEGNRIVSTLEDVHITFLKVSMGNPHTGLNLGIVGHTDANSAFFGAIDYATIKLDLYKIRRNIVPESRIAPVLAWILYHELRHAEAKLKIGEGAGSAIDRNLDFYFYPSADQGERAFIDQAKIPLKAGSDGKMMYDPGL